MSIRWTNEADFAMISAILQCVSSTKDGRMSDIGVDNQSDVMTVYDLLNQPLRSYFTTAAAKPQGQVFERFILPEMKNYIGTSYQVINTDNAEILPKIKTTHIDVTAEIAQKKKTVPTDLKHPNAPLTLGLNQITPEFEQATKIVYAQDGKSAFSVRPDEIDFAPHIKWGEKTWFGVSGETEPAGADAFKPQAGQLQNNFFGFQNQKKDQDNSLSISGEAYIKYQSENGMSLRIGVTPPIQDVLDKTVEPETKWHVRVKIPLKF